MGGRRVRARGAFSLGWPCWGGLARPSRTRSSCRLIAVREVDRGVGDQLVVTQAFEFVLGPGMVHAAPLLKTVPSGRGSPGRSRRGHGKLVMFESPDSVARKPAMTKIEAKPVRRPAGR